MGAFLTCVALFLLLNLIARHLEREAWKTHWLELRLPRLLLVMETLGATMNTLAIATREAADAMVAFGEAWAAAYGNEEEAVT